MIKMGGATFKLRDIVEVVAMAAGRMIEHRGFIRPMYFIGTTEADGDIGLNVCPAPHRDKDVSVALIRELLVVVEAKFVVFTDEAWVVEGTGKFNPDIVVSTHPDRREVVILTAEDDNQHILAQLPIIRDAAGKPSLGPIRWVSDRYGRSEGRLIGLMPQKGVTH
jgi:hypothetical protein